MSLFGDALREALGVPPTPDGDPLAATRLASVVGLGSVPLRHLDLLHPRAVYEIAPSSEADLALMPDDWLEPAIREEDVF